jgi:hypothetical protein
MWRCECGEGVADVDHRIMRVQLMLSLHNSGSDVDVRWRDFELPNSASRLRRIRDKLISEDRFNMALDLSTKCQLECASVWADWARSLVVMGQYVFPLFHLSQESITYTQLDTKQRSKSCVAGPRQMEMQ